MIKKIADSGITYHQLELVFSRGGDRGLRSFLSENVGGKARVTRNNRVIDAMVGHFSECDERQDSTEGKVDQPKPM